MAARCLNEVVCTAETMEAPADAARVPVTLRTHRAGLTELVVTAELADGTVVEDRFCVRVVRATSMEVTCPGCQEGVAPGGSTSAECRLFNRAVSAAPLLGSCVATELNGEVTVTGLPPADTWRAHVPPDPSVGVANGTLFDVRKVSARPGAVLFEHRGLLTRVDAR